MTTNEYPIGGLSEGLCDINDLVDLVEAMIGNINPLILVENMEYWFGDGYAAVNNKYVKEENRKLDKRVCDGKRDAGGTLDRLLTARRLLMQAQGAPFETYISDILLAGVLMGWAGYESCNFFNRPDGTWMNFHDPRDLTLAFFKNGWKR